MSPILSLIRRRTAQGTGISLLVLTATLSLLIIFDAEVFAASSQTHIVAPGERLASIARRYCTTWYELYDLNRHTIGSNPDYLPAGTTITVIDRCHAGGGQGGIDDRGPTNHARGTVSGGTYSVQHGDTIYSIANRFGVDQYALMRANGLHNPTTLRAGSSLTIPGLGPWSPVPPSTPTRPPGPGSYVTITSPTSGARLPVAFTVSGRGGHLYEGNVVVQARDRSGAVLAERATALQSNTMGMGGEGSFNVQLTVNVAFNTPGVIVAFSPDASTVYASVDVTYSASNTNSYVAINEPTSGASLPATFIARGTGRGFFEGNVVVQAQDGSGRILYEVATTLQGANVGTGGEGIWTAQLTIDQVVDGRIVAFSPDSAAYDSVAVRFNGSSPGPGPSRPVKDFHHGECVIWPRAGAPAYSYPDGPQRETFAGGSEYDAKRGVYVSGMIWYYVDIAPSSDSPFIWVKYSDLESKRGACTW